MSTAGAAERGFTLIELLVVLTIGALMAAVALPRVWTLLRPDIDRTTRRVALAIRDQRSTAMRTGYTVSVTDPRCCRCFRTVPSSPDVAFGERGLVFFPNGTSTGGTLVLEASDGRRAVNVDWLTGRVTVGPAP